jgi:hypothetical protein
VANLKDAIMENLIAALFTALMAASGSIEEST